MTQLEFCREHDEQAIAHAEVGEPTNIPGVGDRVYVPDESESSVYVRVAGRRFYYDRQGHLTTVRLSCRVLLKDEELLFDEDKSRQEIGVRWDTARDLYHRHGEALKSTSPFCCPNCASPLSVHQPDPDLPECLLATCDNCTSWYLTDSSGTELVLIR